MKTLFVSHAAALGGAELYLLDYLTCSHREGKVVLFAEGAFAESLRAAGVNTEVLAAPGDLLAVARETPGRRGGGVAGGVLALARRLAREAGGFDLLFANSQKAFVVGALAALFARRPIVWCLHDILSAEHFSAANRRLVISLANLTGALVVANSRATADAFVRSGGRAARVRVVYNGIDVDAFREPLEPAAGRAALRDELGVGSAPLVGLFSRLSAWKGQHVLLEALAELPGTHAVLVGDAQVAKRASDLLLEKHQIYVQAINYQTVPVGQERLRITPTPGHHKGFRDHLIESLESVWQELNIKRTSDWASEGGFIGVGVKDAEAVEPLWTDAQLGLTDVVEGMKTGSALGVLENVLAREHEEIRQVQAVAAAA